MSGCKHLQSALSILWLLGFCRRPVYSIAIPAPGWKTERCFKGCWLLHMVQSTLHINLFSEADFHTRVLPKLPVSITCSMQSACCCTPEKSKNKENNGTLCSQLPGMLLHEDSPSSKDCKGILLAREQAHCEAFKSAPTASKFEGLRVFPQTAAGNWSCQC